ncbi:MAG: DUF1648 domain-containing protein [Streptococcus sp.]|nr:DUF1648 domain-containing protein [Streptococcus sp.]
MKKQNKFEYILSIVVILLPLVYVASVYQDLPQKLTIRFTVSNHAISYLDKNLFLFLMPLFVIAVNSFIYWTTIKKPIVNQNFRRMIVWLTPLIYFFIDLFIIYRNLDSSFNIGKLGVLILGLVLIIFGNFVPKKVQEDRKPGNRNFAYILIFAGMLAILTLFFF